MIKPQIIALNLQNKLILIMGKHFNICLMIVLSFQFATVSAQSFKYYYSNSVKFLKPNSTDSLKMPFTGGMNAPQIFNYDFNHDGVQDIYIFDRAGNKSLAFVRSGNSFIYSPNYDGQFPRLTDWVALADFDGDTIPDIYTEVSLDRRDLVDTIQDVTISGLRILRNISTKKAIKFKQVNNQVTDTGGWIGTYKIDPSNITINYTDIAGIGDLDGDGDADVLPFVQSNLSPNYYENYQKNPHNIKFSHDSTRFVWRDQCWGYMMYDRTYKTNTFELGLGQDQMASCIYQMYEKSSKHTNNTVTFLDYNGDGVKDLIYGDGGYNNLLLLINGRKLNSHGRDSIISQDTAFPSNTTRANFINFPAAYYADVDGDGTKELMVTTNEPLSAKSTNNVWSYENTGSTDKPVFSYVGNKFFAYDESIDVGTRSAPTFTDIDNDGDQDLIIGTNGDFAVTKYFSDRLVLYKNIGKVAGRCVFELADTNFLQLSKDTPVISITPTFADLNNDGKKDLILGDLNGYLLYYVNNSVGTNYNFTLQPRNFGNIDVGSNASPVFYDMDKDGDLDLICGTRNGFLRYYANTGTASVPQFSNTPTIDTLGKIKVNHSIVAINGYTYYDATGYATPAIYDLDGDSNPELIVGSLYGTVSVYTGVNLTPGSVFTKLDNLFVDFSDSTNAHAIHFGNQAKPCIALLDEDSKPDMLVGNIRGGITFFGTVSNTKPGGLSYYPGKEKRFDISPNPTEGLVTIGYSNLDVNGDIRVYNQLGQLLKTGKVNHYLSESTIDLGYLNVGIYFIQISTSDYSETHKIIKQQ